MALSKGKFLIFYHTHSKTQIIWQNDSGKQVRTKSNMELPFKEH